MLGLWSFTNLEFAYALLRVDERLRVYATASLTNVLLTVAGVAGAGGRARRGRARAAAGQLRRLDRGPGRRCGGRCAPGCAHGRRASTAMSVLLRFGLPTVPAEASVYALQHRRPLLHLTTTAARRWPGSTRSRSSSPARSPSSCARSSTRGRRWPTRSPMTREAARLYGLVTTYYLLRQRLGGRRAGPAGPLDPAAAGGAGLLRRLQGAAVGGAGLGPVRAVGGLPGRSPGAPRSPRATSPPRSPGWPPTWSCCWRWCRRWGSPAPGSRCAARTW